MKAGRPRKPDWLRGKGEEALMVVYEIMNDDTAPAQLRLQAAKILAEFDLGKPHQMVMVDAEVETRSCLDGMSLKARYAALRDAAVSLLEQNNVPGNRCALE